MKITSVRATPVNMALEAPYAWSYGLFPGFTQTIIEVETSEGITGLGEAPGTAASIINSRLTAELVGHDPIDIQACELACLPSPNGVQSVSDPAVLAAFGGIEMALWDIRGKLWNRPVYDLLGGAYRKEIPFTDYFVYRAKKDGKGGESTPKDVLDYCLWLRETWGSNRFEGKLSDPDVKRAGELVHVLRSGLGEDAMLRVDSNAAYSVTAARQLAPVLEDARVDNWEDPVGSYEELARLRPHTTLSFSGHNTDWPKMAALKVPDAIVINIAALGGFARTVRFVGACEAAGIDVWCYSGDSGIQSTAYMHLVAATPWVRRPSQSLFHMQPHDVTEEGPLRPRNNMLRVPEKPGLGVTLDRDRLKFLHQAFLNEGPLNKFIDPQGPGRMRRLPLV